MSISRKKIFQEKNYKTLISMLIIVLFIVTLLPLQAIKVNAAQTPNQVFLPMVMKNDSSNSLNCPDGPDQWLCLVNYYRNAAGLKPVVNNSSYNSGVIIHNDYLLNCRLQIDINKWHDETECPKIATDVGDFAGENSNITFLDGLGLTVKEDSIDLWMEYFNVTDPKHRMNHRYNMLHPDFSESGFDLSCNNSYCVSSLNVLQSLPKSYEVTRTDVVYPGDGQQNIPAKRYGITWGFYVPWTSQTNEYDEVTLVSSTIRDSKGNLIPHLKRQPTKGNGFDYVNQIVLYPDISLLPNQTYTVNVTVEISGATKQKTWSFSTGSTP